MDKSKLLKYAGLEEQGPPPVTRENPLVFVHDIPKSAEKYPDQGIKGHMNLSTAANIENFKHDKDLAKKLFDAGTDKRIKVKPGVFLSLSHWTMKELKEQVVEERYRSPDDIVRDMFRDLVTLKRDTAAVLAEARKSKQRPDYAEMLLNELEETYNDIDSLVEKYEDAEVR